jgi:hypothetical protein
VIKIVRRSVLVALSYKFPFVFVACSVRGGEKDNEKDFGALACLPCQSVCISVCSEPKLRGVLSASATGIAVMKVLYQDSGGGGSGGGSGGEHSGRLVVVAPFCACGMGRLTKTRSQSSLPHQQALGLG